MYDTNLRQCDTNTLRKILKWVGVSQKQPLTLKVWLKPHASNHGFKNQTAQRTEKEGGS